MKRLFLLAALVGSTQSHAQTNDTLMPESAAIQNPVQQLNLPDFPAQLNFSQLGKEWRRFTSRSNDAEMTRMYGGSQPQYEQVLNDWGIGVHFTKGEHLTLGKESYLVAYRVDPGMEPQDLQQEIQQRLQAMWGHGQQAPPPRPAGKFSPRASLKLTLLNLRKLGDFDDLKSFDSATDLLSPKDLREMSNYNLRRLGQILSQYGRYQPLPMRDMNALRQMMRNQNAPVSLLRDPANNETYHINTALAGKKTDRIGNLKSVVMVYEAAPSTDNTRGVLYADWHVERVPEWKWEQIRVVKPQPPSAEDVRILSAKRMQRLAAMFNEYSELYELFPRFTDSQGARRKFMENIGGSAQTYQSPVSNRWYFYNRPLA